MNQLANQLMGAQLAKAVAHRSEALETLRKGTRPMGVVQYVAAAISAGIGSAVAGYAWGGKTGAVLGLAVGCSLSLGVIAAAECCQMRKRLEAAIAILLQEVKDAG